LSSLIDVKYIPNNFKTIFLAQKIPARPQTLTSHFFADNRVHRSRGDDSIAAVKSKLRESS
jgi:hypothetical protein